MTKKAKEVKGTSTEDDLLREFDAKITLDDDGVICIDGTCLRTRIDPEKKEVTYETKPNAGAGCAEVEKTIMAMAIESFPVRVWRERVKDKKPGDT